MQPVSPQFLSALRGSHTLNIRIEAWRGDVRVGGELRVLSGSVTAEATAAGSLARVLTVDLAPAAGLWDALAPAGTVLLAWRGVRYPDGAVERVQLGVFDIDEQTLGYGAGGVLRITAPDVWVRVSRRAFETARVTPPGPALNIAVDLAAEAIGMGVGRLDADHAGAVMRRQVFYGQGSRAAAVAALGKAAGAWVHTDGTGRVTTRPVPSVTDVPVWTVDASQSGVLLDAARSRHRRGVTNVFVMMSGDAGGDAPFAPVVVADDDPASPTWVGGPFGRVVQQVVDPLLTTAAQARISGEALLRASTGLAARLELDTVVNPALEPGDVLDVLLPSRHGDRPVVERHLIDAVTIPLTAGGTQTIRSRSTRPDLEAA